MPTEAEQAADHTVQSVTFAVMDLWNAYSTPEGKDAIRAAIKRLGKDWVSLGDLLKHASQNSDIAA